VTVEVVHPPNWLISQHINAQFQRNPYYPIQICGLLRNSFTSFTIVWSMVINAVVNLCKYIAESFLGQNTSKYFHLDSSQDGGHLVINDVGRHQK